MYIIMNFDFYFAQPSSWHFQYTDRSEHVLCIPIHFPPDLRASVSVPVYRQDFIVQSYYLGNTLRGKYDGPGGRYVSVSVPIMRKK